MGKGNETQRRSFGSGLELMAGSRPGVAQVNKQRILISYPYRVPVLRNPGSWSRRLRRPV